MASAIRVRYAPSPTGDLHLGGLRTALYNYLFAKKHGGVNILRIEDTDQGRSVEGAVEHITTTLGWAGIQYDEGPHSGGEVKYFQSERLDLYKEHVDILVDRGHAYTCFCTPERLDLLRRECRRQGITPRYDRHCLHLSREESSARISGGEPYTIRMKVPQGATAVADVIRGTVAFENDRVDDQVLLKSDGFPTYHLASVVDDHHMDISHVIRGEEWLPSAAKHMILYDAFDWPKPHFAHLPLLLNDDKSKLSKRKGNASVSAYMEGFMPEAVVNFVALLGWNPGDTREIFSMGELIHEFSLERVQKGGAVVSKDKLAWINNQHIRRMATENLDELVSRARPHLERELPNVDWQSWDKDYVRKVIDLLKERCSHISDYPKATRYFFEEPQVGDTNFTDSFRTALVSHLMPELENLPGFDADSIQSSLKNTMKASGLKQKDVLSPLRRLLTGESAGPGLAAVMALLGREVTLRRLRAIDAAS